MPHNHVIVGRDHIERLATTNPLASVEELIWNALDSGSKKVEVVFRQNKMGGIQDVEIIDKGTGIHIDDLSIAFGSLGESKKLTQKTTSDGRLLHGREGRGRFKALSLSNNPVWKTVYKEAGKFYEYCVDISHISPDYYDNTNPKEVPEQETGTRVILKDITQGQGIFSKYETAEKIARTFALYLTNYPNVKILYDGKVLRLDNIIANKKTYNLTPNEDARLTVIEWKVRLDNKTLYLCNETGFSRHELPAGVRSPSIDYTAYLSSPKIEKHYSDSSLAFDTMHEDIKQLVELAKDQLRKHIRLQMAKEAADVVEEWKELEIYPYKEVVNPIEQVEKEVFDIVAARVNEQHPTFKDSDTDNKKLTLALIKQSLETNPSSLTSILRDVLKLPAEEQDEFADLLKRTTLSSIIRASSIVTQRLDAIRAFEYIIFDKEWKKKLLERTQLHRLLVHELWIFGEDYTLDNDDESLTQVLKKHIQKLGREELAEDIKVETIEGVQGIPDLLLSRRFTYSRDQFENLVIELKRPSVTLGQSELGQLEDYAITVSEDEMFDTNKCRWKFVLLGNNLNDYVKAKADQDGLPKDCAFKSKNGNVSVYVKCWADIFAEAKQRYEFFRKSLEIEAKKESGMEKWKNKYSHIITGRGASKKKDKEITQNH